MRRDYAAAYRRLYERHWWWRAREAAVLAVLERFVTKDRRGGDVLDVGCGDGLFFGPLARFGTVYGLEPDPATSQQGNPYEARIHRGGLDADFRPGRGFGVLTMLDVLEHIEDDAAAAARVCDLLQPGGTAVLTVPAHGRLWTSHDTMNRHFRRYSAAALRDVLEGAGLIVADVRFWFHWVAAAKLAVRLKERLQGPSAETPRVPAAMVNRVLRAFSTAELRGGRGLGLPFGSSLLAVARRPDPATPPAGPAA